MRDLFECFQWSLVGIMVWKYFKVYDHLDKVEKKINEFFKERIGYDQRLKVDIQRFSDYLEKLDFEYEEEEIEQ